MRRTALVLCLVAGVCTAAFGQSFAELAKKTEEQRNAKKADGQKTSDTSAQSSAKKVYTNKDLKDEPAALTIAGSPTAPADKPSSSAKAEPDESTRAAEYRQIAKKDEAYWKARMRDLQSALDTDQIRLAAMESRVASLSADLNLAGVTERLVLRREREEAATEVTRLKAAVLADSKAINTAEEEARRASVPPGWLRP